MNSATPRRRAVSAAPSESLEERQLLSVNALFIQSSGEVDLVLDHNDSVRIREVAGNIRVEQSADGVNYTTVSSLPITSASAVKSIIIAGGQDANTINLSGVNATSFPALTSISVDAGNGDDTIIGSFDLADQIDGGHGNDTINSLGGNDTILGNDGDDVITAGDGNDSISGGDGHDSISGEAGDDSINSGDGNDSVSGGSGQDNVFAGNGEDLVHGDAGNDILNGDGGKDTVFGDDGNDSILGGEFADSLLGGSGNDTINGQAGNDIVSGGDGNDFLKGGLGNDLLSGNAGNDTLNAEAGNDRLIGDDGNDSLLGGAGTDSLEGNAGNDTLQGQAGNDTLNGGGGADNLNGGDGNDFIQSLSTGIVINDVKVGEVNSGTVDAVFSVGLTVASAVPVTVTYTTSNGSAKAGNDYLPVSGTLTFAPGQTLLTVAVPVIGDTNIEANETFKLNLSNAVNTTIIDATGLGTILDNDSSTAGVGITVGQNVNVSQLAGSQTDVQIAVNPVNPQNVVTVGNGGTTDSSALFIANSFDGGTTWTTQTLGANQDGIAATGAAQRSDASVAFDRFGNLHVAYLADPNTAAATRTRAIVEAFSTDGGVTFSTQIVEALSSNNDKPQLAIGPDAANLATQDAVYVTFKSASGLGVRGAIATGLGSLSSFSAAGYFATASAGLNDAVASVGPEGQFVVTWSSSATPEGPGNVFVDRDLNGLVGGFTFAPDITVSPTVVGSADLIPASPDRGISASPFLAYDRSGGAHDHRLYLAYADAAATPADHSNSNIFVRFSDNHGATWSTAVQVNDDTTSNSQFLQSISVDQVTGELYLSWYDARNDLGTTATNVASTNTDAKDNTEVQVFMSASVYNAAGTLTFAPNKLVSAGVSNQARDTNNTQDFGGNGGISAHNGIVYLSWADNSNSTADNPDGSTTFDAYIARTAVTINNGSGEQFGRVVGVQQSTVTGGPGVGNSPTAISFNGADRADTLGAGSGLDDRAGIYTGQELIFAGQDADPHVVQAYSGFGATPNQFTLSTPLFNAPTVGDSFQVELSQRDVFDVVLLDSDPRFNANAQPLTNATNLKTNDFQNAQRVLRFLNEQNVADVNEPVAGQQVALLNNWALANGQVVGTTLTGNPNKFHEFNGAIVDNKNSVAGAGGGPVASAAGGELNGTRSNQTLQVKFQINTTFSQLTQAPRDENLFVITQTSIGTLLPTALILDAGDTIVGGEGEDTLVGSSGDDFINGQGGNDIAFGGAGNDFMLGGAGNDTLDGQQGNDTLNGQAGNDVLLGGENDDTFVLDPNGGGNDSANGGLGLNQIQVVGTNLADTLTVSSSGSVLSISNGIGTIAVTANIQNVSIDARGGNDTVTVNNIAAIGFLVLNVQGGDGNDVLNASAAGSGSVRVRLNGDAGNDTLTGSNGGDTLGGGAGNDVLAGLGGNDSIDGGIGDDNIGGGNGNDTVVGGDGADSINGQLGDDSLSGGNGNDTLLGADGNDTLKGEVGDDVLNGLAGDDSIEGGVGFDAIAGGIGNDTLDGGRNDDTINGNAGNDKIRGDHGNDYIDAGIGLDTVNGGDGDDTITTADGSDAIDGDDGNDLITTADGDDTITGGDGDDTILGGGGADIILGGDGNDQINGQGGSDTVAGNQGSDVIADPIAEIKEQFVLSADIIEMLKAL